MHAGSLMRFEFPVAAKGRNPGLSHELAQIYGRRGKGIGGGLKALSSQTSRMESALYYSVCL